MIHRTRDGEVPDGGPEAGRTIVRMGKWFVEYSGLAPTQQELNDHLNPPKPPPTPNNIPLPQLVDLLRARGVIP